LLLSYNWPGNIRELRNIVERAMILCGGDRIRASDLPLGGVAVDENDGAEFLSLDELERLHIRRVLDATERNLSRAAEILGVTRTTLYNKLRKYDLDEPPV
jgi:transcriptional regulator of acetoin/glycerol metabolism